MSNGPADLANWTNEQLMGPNDAATLAAMKKKNPDLWGRPGFLTEEEAKTYVSNKCQCKSQINPHKEEDINTGMEQFECFVCAEFILTHLFLF